jgi:hypothetical protein
MNLPFRCSSYKANRLYKLAALWALLILLFLTPRIARGQIGYVLDLNGRWILERNPSQDLTRGQGVPAKGVIRVESPTRENYIVIASPGGQIFERRQCSKPTECSRPLYLPATRDINRPPLTPLEVAFSTAMRLIFGDPDRHSVHRVRGGELFETVAELKEGGKADLSQVFKKMQKGQFYVRLRTLTTAGKATDSETLGPLKVDWDPATGSLPVGQFLPGLYEISLIEPRGGDFEATGINAWILLTDIRDYEQAAASFKEAVTLTENWGNQVKRETIRSFLRSHLDQLDSSATKR